MAEVITEDNTREDDRNRKFYDISFEDETGLKGSAENELIPDENLEESEKLLKYIADSEIGNQEPFITPFGTRRVVYCDYTASGRSLSFIEQFIHDHVLNEYGNTHTTNTVTALQTTLFRSESRDYIKSCVNAGELDCLIFVGSGCTGAVHKLINALDFKRPPIVIVSPFEHHSNLLPWREAMADIVYANEASDGSIDLDDLETKLKKFESENIRVKIGTFCAASNVTGILQDVDRISILLHRYGFLSFWDYATAAAYVKIDMNPFAKDQEHSELAYKDAIFFSTHKFVGGPQTPGILVAKKKLFHNRVPNGCGGGTVFFVTKYDHRYLKNDEMREEGGTPAIIESIRAGLVFQLKQAVGVETILNKEHYFTKKAIKRLTEIPNLHILGSLRVQRLPIFSFLIEHEQTGFYLHPNFVGALLNDLFGIQSRSGCACAGPYAQYLLGIDYSMSKLIEQCLVQDERIDRHHLRVRVESSNAECIRPGFTRLNFAFFMSDSRVDFVLDAIEFVCRFGWQFLPHYVFNLETGEFRHRNFQVFRDRKWLGQINYKSGLFNYTRKVNNSKESINDCPKTDEECLANAYLILENIKQTMQIGDQRLIFSEQVSKLRWFLLPSEAYGILHEKESLYSREKIKPPFRPRRYNLDIEKDLSNLYDLKLVATNGEEEKSTNSFDYSQFAETFYSDQDLERYIRVIQNDVKSELEKEASFHVRRYSHRNSSSSSYKEHHQSTASDTKEKANHHPSIDESEEKLICQLKNKSRVLSGEKDGKVDQKWHNPPKHIFKPFVEAIKEFEMIKNGDKILVCLSGGKDSLSLLHAIRQYKYFAKSINIEFEFGAVTVDPKSPSYDPSSLKGYLAELNVPYFYEEQDILVTAENLPYECASICSFCSRMKRGRIYSTARQHGYNVLALGQHLDDVCESFMMSLFYNGRLWSMKASYENEDGDLRIIRPFVYVREKDLRAFAEQNHLPIIAENCPACFEAPKERHRMKQMLAQQELLFPNLFSSMLSAIKPIIGIGKCRLSVKALNEFALKMIKRNPDLYDELVKTSDSSESFVDRNNEDDSF